MKTPHHTLIKHQNGGLHRVITWGTVDIIERIILRPLPTLIAIVLCLISFGLIYCIAILYSYHIAGLNVLIPIYIVGYAIGCIYEYLMLIIKKPSL